MRNIKIYQVYYDEATKQSLDPYFIPLDNCASPRIDWFEYWPIRTVLLSEKFDDEDYLGFFSPKFKLKTHCTGASVMETVSNSNVDVLSYSPFFDLSAMFINPFKQGELCHGGLIQVSQEAMDFLGIDIDLNNLVSDQTTTIFSNYFVAKYKIWKEWFYFSERIFEICEQSDHPLGKKLCGGTYHRDNNYPMKVFLMERLITVVMEKYNLAAKLCLNIKNAPSGTAKGKYIFDGLVLCDALKGQYKRTMNPVFMDQYDFIRRTLLPDFQ